MTDTQADLTERARSLLRKIGIVGEDGEPYPDDLERVVTALQSEREAAAAEARRALEEIADMEGSEDMTDYRFAERALAIANAFLASPAPQDDLEGDVKHGNAEYFRAALAHAAAEARRAAIEECAAIARSWQQRSADALRLAAGEMTAQEIRTARAIAATIERTIAALASPAPQEETR